MEERRTHIIAELEKNLEDSIAFFRSLSPDADFDREGRHAFHGHGKLERFIQWVYEHVHIHMDDIHKKRTL